MQFSAGVNLNYVMDFAKEKNWKAIEKFIHHFQMTCKQLKYSNNVVVSAPSGLALGGGFIGPILGIIALYYLKKNKEMFTASFKN